MQFPKIRKVGVAPGIYWVEIPEADVRVVCGCPADTVKHLMRRGLIVNREVNGVTFEDGPNAILLSDVTLQSGEFANLAEFPILQMLYRQGMLLPDHPKNNGDKPLLLGLKRQVECQKNYIFRGNYGLISVDEIQACGIDPELAAEMMRIKLRFAFDKITNPDELLDSRFTDDGDVFVRNGLSLKRIAHNNYEFSYEGETATVDLNLSRDQTYEPPFSHGAHSIKREYFSIIHSGDGDGWDINRPAMASIICFQGKLYLIDAGPNLLSTLNALGISVNEIAGIFHTHSHDDHFAGLTSLLEVDKRIRYFATPLVRSAVMKKFAALLDVHEGEFDRYFDVCDIEFDRWNDIDGLEVKPIYSPHPVETNIFQFRTLGPQGYRVYAHYADIASFDVIQSMLQKDVSSSGISRTRAKKVADQYLETVDLKKLDIGGGLIHGDAKDFIDDRSGKIIFSHIARDLTAKEKRIGSSAPFGASDVLIPGYQNYVWQYASEYLLAYFPNAPRDQIRMLLNNPVEELYPGSLIIRDGEANEEIFLILTGNVQMIQSRTNETSILSVGVLVGEISGLHHAKSTETYRTASFVNVLKIPCQLYIDFVNRNQLFSDINELTERRDLLQNCWIFREAMSYRTQNKIAHSMNKINLPKGQCIDPANSDLMIMSSGRVRCSDRSGLKFEVGYGECLNERSALRIADSNVSMDAVEDSVIYSISNETIRDIPIVHRKLLETVHHRGNSRR